MSGQNRSPLPTESAAFRAGRTLKRNALAAGPSARPMQTCFRSHLGFFWRLLLTLGARSVLAPTSSRWAC